MFSLSSKHFRGLLNQIGKTVFKKLVASNVRGIIGQLRTEEEAKERAQMLSQYMHRKLFYLM